VEGEAKMAQITYRRRTGSAVLGFAMVGGLFSYSFRMVRVQGHSMDPTYYNGQWLLVRRMNWPLPPLRVGDVIVFRLDNGLLVKRIAALGGHAIPSDESTVVVHRSRRHPGTWDEKVVAEDLGRVPEGQMYVLGDNPPVSDDSRSFGPVPVSTLVGLVVWVRDPGQAP
jgi:signal peptidase I